MIDQSLAMFVGRLSSSVVGKLCEPLVSWTKSKAIEGVNEIKAVLCSFDKYESRMAEKHGVFHSFVFPNNGQQLVDYYEPLYLNSTSDAMRKAKNSHIKIDGLPLELFNLSTRVLIVDSAGMGKSTLLKYLFLSALESNERIPLFLELRKLNSGTSLIKYLLSEVNGGDSTVEAEVFDILLNSGKFILFLDGFDEVAASEKARVASDVMNIISNYAGNYFVLSSRDEPGLANLFGFRRFGIEKLNKNQASSLIRRLSPTPEQATSLCDKLESRAENNLKEFLTSPLLVSLLVKSYIHSPILPVRLSEFYRQVFDALYQTHDASKELEGFSREKQSGLDMDSFHRVLRALGILTYVGGVIEYGKDEVIEFITKAQGLVDEKTFKPSGFLDDLLKAVPLFISESGMIRWAHKSLQEYFAAAYIAFDSKENEGKLLSQIFERGTFAKDAGLLAFCADIDSKSFKRYLVKPLLKKMVNEAAGLYAQGFDWLSPSDRKARVCSTLLLKLRVLMLGRPNKSVKNVMDRFRSDVSELLLPDASRNITKITLAFDRNIGLVLNEPGSINYVVEFSWDQSFIILSIISDRLGYSKISKRPKASSVKSAFRGLPKDKFITLDDDPNSPLNNKSNFNRIQNIISIFGFLNVDLDEASRILSDIEKDELLESNIRISFDNQ